MTLVNSSALLLGTAASQHDRGSSFSLDPSWLTRGTVIVGKSGTGKSHDIDLISKQLSERGNAVVLLDRTGEHAEALGGRPDARVLRPGKELFLSVLAPDTSSGDYAEAVESALDTFTHFLKVCFEDKPTPLQQRVFRECLLPLYAHLDGPGKPPTVAQFVATVRLYEEHSQRVHGVLESCESLISRFHPLAIGRTGKVFDSDQITPLDSFFDPGIHIVDLSLLREEPSKNLVSQVLVKRLYRMAKDIGITQDLRQLIIVDEAHHIAPNIRGYTSFLDYIGIENRKYGQSVMLATTSPSQLSETLLRNVSVRISHMLDDGEDIDLMLRFMVNKYEADRFISDFMMLDIGEAMVRVSMPVHVGPEKVKIAEEV
jgi:DNA helicase HerA-like ATPase